MEQQPLIGIPGRRRTGADVAGTPEPLGDAPLDLYFADYALAVIEAGGLPIHIPLDVDPATLVRRIDGVLLPGGTDVDPARYGADPHPEILALEPARDELELALLDGAVARDLPVLGICRGLQLINVFAGGTLHQHVAPHSRFDLPPHTEEHGVEIKDGSTLHALYGPSRRVNTLHHQTVDRPGAGLTVTAISDDGEVEGLEHEDARLIAVQWHPELMHGRATDPIFGWLVEAAADRGRR